MRPKASERRHRLLLGLLTALAVVLPGTALTQEINEGELEILTEKPSQAPHRHSKHIVVTAESLKSGWIRSEQCHRNLDQVKALEVVFAPGRVRDLKIVKATNIEKAWIENDSVQLQNVGANASLCISSENRTVEYDTANRSYILKSGPYMRRFFDGYFPMHVNLVVDYPAALLEFIEANPRIIRDKITSRPGTVSMDVLFEGRLLVALRFKPAQQQARLARRAPPAQ